MAKQTEVKNMTDRKLKNPISCKDYDKYMQAYFQHLEVCDGCEKTRSDHTLVKEITDYGCQLFYRCADGGITTIGF